MEGYDQSEQSHVDNFEYYGLGERLEALFACPVQSWLDKYSFYAGQEMVPLFDAIVTDPPYNKREKGDPSEVLPTLLRLAKVAIKPGGRLVLWYPTRAFATEDEVRENLRTLDALALPPSTSSSSSLSLYSVTPEKMNDTLWRWLVVYDVE